MSDPEDARLLRGAMDGNPEDFRGLIEKYQKPLYNFARKFTGSPQDAEDLVQDTFLKLHGSMASVRESEKLRSWLYAVTANKARNLLRRAKILRFIGLEFLSDRDAPRSVEKHPGGEVEEAEALLLLEKAARRLPIALRGPILLKYFQGLPEEEIAEVFALNLKVLRVRLSRGRKQLWEAYSRLKNS